MKIEANFDGATRYFEGDPAAAILVEPGVYHVIDAAGRSHEVRIRQTRLESGGDGFEADVEGRNMVFALTDPREAQRHGVSSDSGGRRDIVAPMPGKVIRLLVAAGDSVEPGQGLVVVEAMKMQNELKSPKTGRVIRIVTAEGATVAAGDILMVIE